MAGELNNVEIVSVGRWKGSKTIDITSAMLDDMVNSFAELSNKVEGYRPPLKLGHTEAQRFIGQGGSGAPALGWIKSLQRMGDKIVANFSDVPSAVLDMIKGRRYNSVSIELYPSVDYAGSKFSNVISGVALLGAELPAVKGLRELSASLFGDTNDLVALTEKEETMTPYTQEQHDALVKAAVAEATTKLTEQHNLAITALNGELEKAKTAKTQAETALAVFKEDRAKDQIVAVVDKAIAEGRVLPTEKGPLVALGASMQAVVKLGDKEKSGFEAFSDMINARPKIVKLGERMVNDPNAEYDDPATEVDARTKQKITAAGGPTKLAYGDAMRLVLEEDQKLKTAYAKR